MTRADPKGEANYPLQFDEAAIHLSGSQLIEGNRNGGGHLLFTENAHPLLPNERRVVAGSGRAFDFYKLPWLQTGFGMFAEDKHSVHAIHYETVAVLVMKSHNSPQAQRV